MQQTLLAMLALMMVTFLNFSQMQSSLQNQKQVIRSEMEQMALGVAMQTMEVVRARAFDAATVGDDEDNISSVHDFTDSFTTGRDCEAFGGADTCDDVDDFHEMVPATVPFETPEFSMQFKVEIEVRYVNEDMVEVAGPTYRKEVIIKVQDEREDSFLHEPITYSEVLTYY